jgi:hypothetical protein
MLGCWTSDDALPRSRSSSSRETAGQGTCDIRRAGARRGERGWTRIHSLAGLTASGLVLALLVFGSGAARADAYCDSIRFQQIMALTIPWDCPEWKEEAPYVDHHQVVRRVETKPLVKKPCVRGDRTPRCFATNGGF